MRQRQQCPAEVSEQQGGPNDSFRNPTGPGAMTLSARVRIIIARVLVEGNCTCKRVASALGLHPRTLQRRLRQERESFESIKDSVRRDVALRYLRQPNVSLVRVTEILGYSETSVLSRSCHRWFATSPRRLRNDLSRLAPAEADAFDKIDLVACGSDASRG